MRSRHAQRSRPHLAVFDGTSAQRLQPAPRSPGACPRLAGRRSRQIACWHAGPARWSPARLQPRCARAPPERSLRVDRTRRSQRRAHERNRLASEHAPPWRARRPVDRIGEHAGGRSVVLRRSDQDCAGGGDAILELAYHLRVSGSLQVFVKERQAPDIVEVYLIQVGATSCAARSSPRLYDPRLRLPAMPRTVKVLVTTGLSPLSPPKCCEVHSQFY